MAQRATPSETKAAGRLTRLAVPSASLDSMLLLLAIAFAATASGIRVALSDFPDDAWITFTYARNLAAGDGFVFSERYPTWGTTTPLFALLLSLPAMVGIPLSFAARQLDMAALVIQALSLSTLLRASGYSRWVPLFLVLWSALWWLPGSFPGMEYGLHGAFACWALAGIVTQRWTLGAIPAGLAPVLRPDGFLLLLLYGAAWLWHTRGRQDARRVLPILLVPTLLWYSFAILRFGSPMPRTLAMRQLEAVGWGGFFTFWRRYQLAPRDLNFFLLPALLAAPWMLWRAPRLLWVAAWFCGYIGLYTLMGLPGLPQYLAPLNVFAIAGNSAALGLAFRARWTQGLARRATVGVMAAACMANIAWLSHLIWRLEFRKWELPAKYQAYEAVSRYIEEVFDPRTIYASNEIGYMGHRLPHDLVELGGLVNPEGLLLAAEGRMADLFEREAISVLVLPRGMEQHLMPSPESYGARMFTVVGDINTWDYGPVVVYARHDLFTPVELEDQRDLLRSHARNVTQGLDVRRPTGSLLPGPAPAPRPVAPPVEGEDPADFSTVNAMPLLDDLTREVLPPVDDGASAP